MRRCCDRVKGGSVGITQDIIYAYMRMSIDVLTLCTILILNEAACHTLPFIITSTLVCKDQCTFLSGSR